MSVKIYSLLGDLKHNEGDAGFDLYACLFGKDGKLRVSDDENDYKFLCVPPSLNFKPAKINKLESLSDYYPCPYITSREELCIPPEWTVFIPSGVWVKCPIGKVPLCFPRSSAALSYMEIANTAGVIDPNYQGEIMIPIRNTMTDDDDSWSDSIKINHLDRIAQMVIVNYEDNVQYSNSIEDLYQNKTNRAGKGFGSSGA